MNDLQTLSAAEKLPPELMLLKMENETIMAAARIAPRDPMAIVSQLKTLIDAYPAAADEAIYSKPVGSVYELTCEDCGIKYEVVSVDRDTTCPGCDSKRHSNQRKVKKFAEGLSIRAAESIRSIFGYTRLATTAEMLPDGRARITGVLVDYAAGNVTSDERIVSPFYKSRGGQMVKTPEDRFLGVVVKAEKSKLRRDVILDSVPNIVKALFRDECEKKMVELVSPEVIEQKILPAFMDYGIELAHLEKIIGRPYKMGWREEDRLALRKILSALKNEETTVAELLSDIDHKNGHGPAHGSLPPTVANGGASSSDLTSPTKTQHTAPVREEKSEPTKPAEQPPQEVEQQAPPADEPVEAKAPEPEPEPLPKSTPAPAREEAADPYVALDDALADCKIAARVNLVEAEWLAKFSTSAERQIVRDRCHLRREEIAEASAKRRSKAAG